MTAPVLHFVVVGQDDHPIFETDLFSKSSDASGREVRDHGSLRRGSKPVCLIRATTLGTTCLQGREGPVSGDTGWLYKAKSA
jgi:hypothetical protein